MEFCMRWISLRRNGELVPPTWKCYTFDSLDFFIGLVGLFLILPALKRHTFGKLEKFWIFHYFLQPKNVILLINRRIFGSVNGLFGFLVPPSWKCHTFNDLEDFWIIRRIIFIELVFSSSNLKLSINWNRNISPPWVQSSSGATPPTRHPRLTKW